METVHNRYEIIETLGVGATSRVDKARDPLIGRTVALKTFLQGFGSRDLHQQFAREAQIIGRLSHPNIVSLYDVGTDKDGVPYFVMEYVEGKTLEDVLATGPLPLPRVALWGGDLAGALSRAHRAKIIHGDVKPANVLITKEGQVKLGDFGVARFSTQVSGTASVLGTPAYLSPEQISGHSQDTRSDLFSLGIILYQMACGVRPFNGSSVSAVCAQIISSEPLPPSHHNPGLPTEFDHVVMRCLAKNPEERYPTAESLASSLYPFARASSANAVGAVPQLETAELPRRHPASWWSGPIQHNDVWSAACLLLIVGGFSWMAFSHRHTNPVAASPVEDVAPASISSSAVAKNEPALTSGLIDVSDVSVANPPASPSSPVTSSRMPERKDVAVSAVAPKPSKPRATVSAGSKLDKSALTQSASHATGPASPVAEKKSAENSAPAHAPSAALRIEVVSAIADETLAVYAGETLLVSMRLDAANIGQAVHYDCPLAPGSHPLRVVLYNTDLSLHMQKEGLSQIVADGNNTMNIAIYKKQKLLVRKQTTLDVSWPNPLSDPSKQATPSTNAANLLK